MRSLIIAGAKTALGTVLVALLGFASTKVVALAVGPAGIGVYSLLRQCLMTAVVLATLSPQVAIAHVVADGERHGSLNARLSTVFSIVAAITAMLIAFGIWQAPTIAASLLPNLSAGSALIALLAIPLAINAAFVVLLNVLQAFRSVGAASAAAVAGAAATALFAYPLGRLAERDLAALVALLAIGPIASLAAAALFAWRAGWLAPSMASWLRLELQGKVARRFLRLSGATVLAALIASASLLALRGVVAHRTGLEGAGLFDAAWAVSHNAFGLVLTAFGSYYLPTLIRMTDSAQTEKLVNQALFLTTLAVLPLVAAALAFRDELVVLLYSGAFLEAGSALRWLLFAQCFRIAAWSLSFLALARGRMRALVAADASWSLALLGATCLETNPLPLLEWLGIAYLACYAVYFAFFMAYVRVLDAIRFGNGVTLTWCAVVALALVAALLPPVPMVQLVLPPLAIAVSVIGWRWRAKLVGEPGLSDH